MSLLGPIFQLKLLRLTSYRRELDTYTTGLDRLPFAYTVFMPRVRSVMHVISEFRPAALAYTYLPIKPPYLPTCLRVSDLILIEPTYMHSSMLINYI